MTFDSTTPADLIQTGLYKALAVAICPGEKHRAVSLALLAKALGAVPQERDSLCEVSRRASRFSKRLSSNSIEIGRSCSTLSIQRRAMDRSILSETRVMVRQLFKSTARIEAD